jgi:hypothetical protein
LLNAGPQIVRALKHEALVKRSGMRHEPQGFGDGNQRRPLLSCRSISFLFQSETMRMPAMLRMQQRGVANDLL